MKISISVPPVWRAQGLSEEELLKHLRSCGFRYFCEEFDTSKEVGRGLAAERRSLLKNAGMTAVKARALCEDPYGNIDGLLRVIELCAEEGIRELVVPMGVKTDNSRWEYYADNKAYLARLLPAARENGVKLLIENCGSYQNCHYSHCGYELRDIMEYLGYPEGLGLNLNIANQGLIEVNPYSDTRVFGSALCSVDVSDNLFGMPMGIMKDRENLGLMPLTGYIEFDESFAALKELNYDGVYNLRMNSPRLFDKTSPHVTDSKLAVMPLPLLARHYALAYKSVRYMLETYGYHDEAGENA